MTVNNQRNYAIDMLRGLVMFLMVTVNDFWTVSGVPHFLEHYGTFDDGMGVADIVFPMFLFAMGMSVPYAIERRFSKGLSGESTLGHILSRTLALLLMGAFIVNTETGIAPLLGYGKGVYWLLMVTGFILVWNNYPKDMKAKPWLQLAGAAVLLFLAITYRSADGGLFHAGWWGILGLIGWAYLFTATAYLLVRSRPAVFIGLWAAMAALNLLTAPMRGGCPLLDGSNFISDFARALHLGNGSSVIMALGGTVTTLMSRKLSEAPARRRILSGLGTAVLLVLAGLAAHRLQIVSKNIGTLPWCLYVSAISVAAYTLLRVLEAQGNTSWFKPLAPAGNATLTVYMMPYVYYSFWVFLSPEIPAWLGGWTGVVKCMLFALLCIATAGLLGRGGIKLKI